MTDHPILQTAADVRAALAGRKTHLYRIQDKDGRGPWRPGFSEAWVDYGKDDRLCPPVQIEFPKWEKAIWRARGSGLAHFGCCVEGIRGIHQWFTPDEIRKLRGFGFRLVDASSLVSICTGKHQIIGGSVMPLAYLPEVAWEIAE